MMDVGIEVHGEEELEKLLRELGTLQPFKDGLQSGAIHTKGIVAQYPRVSRRPQPFVSDKQRRGFFAKLSSGEIEVPYRRGISPNSEQHSASWATQSRKDGLEQIIGSDTSYGRLLQDERKQTAYHKGTGWKTVQQIAKEKANEIRRVVEKAMNEAIDKIKGR